MERCQMTTTTIKAGLVGQQAVLELVGAMKANSITHIFPSKAKDSKFHNDAIDELLIDEEGNVMLAIKDSDEVILPRFVTVCK